MRYVSVALLLLIPNLAVATSVVAFSESELAARADVVVLASVVSSEVVNTHGWVTTQTVLQVHQGIKGAREGDVVTVETPGGAMGNRRVVMAGAPSFRVGQLIVGFFERHDAVLRPIGLNYGIYNVGGASGWNAIRNLDELHLVSHDKAPLPKGTVRINAESLNTLLDRLRGEVAAQGSTP